MLSVSDGHSGICRLHYGFKENADQEACMSALLSLLFGWFLSQHVDNPGQTAVSSQHVDNPGQTPM